MILFCKPYSAHEIELTIAIESYEWECWLDIEMSNENKTKLAMHVNK